MLIMKAPQAWIKTSFLIGLIAVLTACGGGGSSNPDPEPPAPDTTPTAFTFQNVDDVEPGSVQTSNTVTIGGIDSPAPISITGGQYAIGSNAPTSAAGTITNGQTVTISLTASDSHSATVTASLTIGGVAGTFNVTTIAEDTTPDGFSFTAVTDVEPGSLQTSNAVTISGIDSPAPISITGGQYAIGSSEPTSTAGTVTNGQTVTIGLTAPESTLTEVTAALTIGGITGSFSVTTIADTTPDDFSFIEVIDVEPGSMQTSNVITVSGIDIEVPISITGGEYAIGEGEYTAAEGMIEPGQSVTVRLTAAAGTEQLAEATLLIGGVEATYSVTTFADTQAPTAEILFPPLVSMTEGTTLLVRGKVMDDYSAIESVQIRVNEGTAQDVALTENDDGTASWQIEVNLTAGENTITVSTEDSVGNSELTAAQVSVRQDEGLGSFPDAENPLIEPGALVIDRLNNRSRLLVSQMFGTDLIYSVDLSTGQRSFFKSFSGTGFFSAHSMLLNESTNQLFMRDSNPQIAILDLDDPSQLSVYTVPNIGSGFVFAFDDSSESTTLMAANRNNGNLVRVPLDFTTEEIFSDSSDAEQGPTIPRTHGMVFDEANHRYLLTSPIDYAIYAVDSTSGTRSIFSQNGDENGLDFGTEPNVFLYHLKMDIERDRVLVAESTSGRIFAIDLATGGRSILTSQTSPNATNPMDRPRDLVVSSPDSYIFVTDIRDESIFAVDIVTGHRVYFTKN